MQAGAGACEGGPWFGFCSCPKPLSEFDFESVKRGIFGFILLGVHVSSD